MDIISLQDLKDHPKEDNIEPMISQYSAQKQRKYSECLEMEKEQQQITMDKILSAEENDDVSHQNSVEAVSHHELQQSLVQPSHNPTTGLEG